MSQIARTKGGELVQSWTLDDDEWERIKTGHRVGDFRMPCCDAPAIPKTSPNFLKFFAHHTGECSSGPESEWHFAVKGEVASTVAALGFKSELERPGKTKGARWIADVYFEDGSRKIAIEVQHSYQHLSKYLSRQERYKAAGVESYWLVYPHHWKTLNGSVGKDMIKNKFGGKFPKEGLIFPGLPELPYVCCEIEGDEARVRGVESYNRSLREWLTAVIQGTFVFSDGRWCEEASGD